jgi:CDGSH-type Zn-finger protein/truncated hemoglobin YjbI
MHDLETDVHRLMTAASALEAAFLEAPGDQLPAAVARLRDSVIRPLGDIAGMAGGENDLAAAASHSPASGARAPEGDGEFPGRLRELALIATRLRVQAPSRPELAEATAALQDLALTLADADSVESLQGELETAQSGLEQQIQAARNGPYLVTNATDLSDWLGRPLPVRPQMALCRCGDSQIKPLCDGTHARNGFTDGKDPNRVADQRDAYAGQQVTVLDNRGICQHSGLCTDRLPVVFRAGQEPFVAPSGGRMDEIIRAVRDCPSGALSYATDGSENRDDADHHNRRNPAIEVSKDGPYRVTGGIRLVGAEGETVSRNEGASREHYALCRCGHSQNKPFCSGMHWYVQFRDPVSDAGQEPTIFEWAGGLPMLTRMTRVFYEKYVPQDPLLAPLFASMSPDHPQRVAEWLAEVFCGPKQYSTRRGGYTHMISEHLGKHITEEQRARWVALIGQASHDAGLPNDPEFRAAFGSYIEWGTRLAFENSQADAQPPPHMPMPRWDWHTAAGPPGSRISALAPPAKEEEHEVVLPAAGEPVSFERHIKPLFRASDRQSMSFAFDLWSSDDVSQHADAILSRIRAGTMPCDGTWPAPKIDVLQRWVDTGKAP